MIYASAAAAPPASSPLWGDEFEFGKVRAKSIGVARQERNAKGRRVAADQKVWQRVASGPAGASIQLVGSRGAKCGLPRYVGERQVESLDFAIAVSKRREADGEFRIDHRVDDTLPAATSGGESFARPAGPVGIVRRDVDENIGIDEDQTSLRVISMTSSVV